ncbi:MAG: methyltransferase domain-containing protein [Candidatus Bathyarchaeota archaeon]|nr:methyltransferase domain-containing protein [Candidatus Bathyarchaeum sp.]
MIKIKDFNTGFNSLTSAFEIGCKLLVHAVRRVFGVSYFRVTYSYKGNSKVNLLSDPLKMFFSVLLWKANGKMVIIEGRMQSGTKSGFLLRKKIEEEAQGYDQGKVGYESKNPFVRLFFDNKIKAVLKVISEFQSKPVCVLDVGCGDGLLLEKLPGKHKVGFDLSAIRLKRAGLRATNASLVCGDAEHLPFKRSSFDVVTCIDTIEHLSNPNYCAECLESSTAKGGLMIVAIPDDRFLSLARFLFMKYPFSLKGHGHVSSFKPDTFVTCLFRSCKLLVHKKIPICMFPVVYMFGLKKVAQVEQLGGETQT